jgi:hypothetical protein
MPNISFKITRNIFYYCIIVTVAGLFTGISSCKSPKVAPTETKTTLLTKNNWIINRFTTIDNSTVQEAKLNLSSKLLYQLEFQFRSNNQVKALDKVTKQVFNGGTWELSADEKIIIIDIPGLKDNFELIEITKNKLVLRPNEKVFPIVDNNTVVNMEFVPTI